MLSGTNTAPMRITAIASTAHSMPFDMSSPTAPPGLDPGGQERPGDAPAPGVELAVGHRRFVLDDHVAVLVAHRPRADDQRRDGHGAVRRGDTSGNAERSPAIACIRASAQIAPSWDSDAVDSIRSPVDVRIDLEASTG